MTIDLFHQLVMEYKGHKVIADYTGQWPNYHIYDELDQWIGCTNSTAGWQIIARVIINHQAL